MHPKPVDEKLFAKQSLLPSDSVFTGSPNMTKLLDWVSLA